MFVNPEVRELGGVSITASVGGKCFWCSIASWKQSDPSSLSVSPKPNQTCAVYLDAYLKTTELEKNLIFFPTQQTDDPEHIKISIGWTFDLLASSFFRLLSDRNSFKLSPRHPLIRVWFSNRKHRISIFPRRTLFVKINQTKLCGEKRLVVRLYCLIIYRVVP